MGISQIVEFDQFVDNQMWLTLHTNAIVSTEECQTSNLVDMEWPICITHELEDDSELDINCWPESVQALWNI